MEMKRESNPRLSTKIDTEFIEEKPYKTCETCARGIVTKNGVLYNDSLALVCKPYLLEEPIHYIDWEYQIE